MDYRERFDRRWTVAVLGGLGKASFVAVVALAVVGNLLLAGAAAAAALGCLLAANLVRRGALSVRGPGMVAVLLGLAAAAVTAIHATGGISSPLRILLAALVALAALALNPLAHLLALSGISLLYTVMALHKGPGPGLVVDLGMFGMLGFFVNSLSFGLRRQRDELVGLAMRDPATGALRKSFFHARLVSWLEAPGPVELALFDFDNTDDTRNAADIDDRLHDAAARLLESVRYGDLVGRVGKTRLAVALPRGAAPFAARMRRKLGDPALCVGIARLTREAETDGPLDPLERARELYAAAASDLHPARAA